MSDFNAKSIECMDDHRLVQDRVRELLDVRDTAGFLFNSPRVEEWLFRLCRRAYRLKYPSHWPPDDVPLAAAFFHDLEEDPVLRASTFGEYKERFREQLFDDLWALRELLTTHEFAMSMEKFATKLDKALRMLPLLQPDRDRSYTGSPAVFQETQSRARDQIEICGKYLSAQEVQDLFGVDLSRLRPRQNLWGIPDEVSVVLPRNSFKARSAAKRLLLGWEYWCKKEGIPLTDEDLFCSVEDNEELRYLRPTWVERSTGAATKRDYYEGTSGQRSLAWGLLASKKDPTRCMGTWLDAVQLHLGIGLRGAADSFPPLEYPSDFEPHHRVTSCLPFSTDRTIDISDIRRLVLSEQEREEDYPLVHSNYLFLGVTAYIRRVVRLRYEIHVDKRTYGNDSFSPRLSTRGYRRSR